MEITHQTLDDFNILRILGVGGQAIVYKAVHKLTDKLCALKVFS